MIVDFDPSCFVTKRRAGSFGYRRRPCAMFLPGAVRPRCWCWRRASEQRPPGQPDFEARQTNLVFTILAAGGL